jgi:predicted RNase H-like HicB family nuclease
MKFKVVIHTAEEGGYWAEVPSLPGCISEGETRAEVQANIAEAITGYLEVLKEANRPPEPEVEVLEVAV